MRFMQIASFYPAYLNAFYGRDPTMAQASFNHQITSLLADGFGGGHLIAPAMSTVGFEPLLVITNAAPAQAQWAMEHGFPAPRSDAELQALVARQIETYQPDVLYVLDPIAFDGRFLAQLKVRPRLIVGWRAANIPASVTWVGYDLMLSSDEGCRRRALEIGASAVANFRPGFPKAIAARVADTPKASDIVFCGQMTVEHQRRFVLLQNLITGLEADPKFSAALHLGLSPNAGFPEALRRYDKGSVWGLEMYRAVRSGRVAPNFHIDLVASRNQNMRLLETTGVGTFMLTEHDDHLHENFEPGRDVETYASDGELVEKARYYLDHPIEREAIALRGQQRCFADHSTERRAQELAALINEHMDRKPMLHRALSSAPTPPRNGAAPADDIAVAIQHLTSGRISEAASTLNATIQKDATNARALHLLGRVAFLVGETAPAAELFQAALNLKLSADQAWLCAADLSVVFVRQNRPSDAIAALRQAYAFNAKGAEIALRLAVLLRSTGATDEAELIATRIPKGAQNTQPNIDSLIDLGHLNPDQSVAPQSQSAAKPMADQNTQLTQTFPNVVFGDGVQCVGLGSIRIGRGSVVGDGSWLNVCINDRKPRMVIGESVLVGRRAVLSSATYLEVGSHTIFGPNVYVASAAHEYVGNHLKPILLCGIRDLGSVIIEENCWLGMNAVVDGDVTVGRGSVVGANSVLRHSIPPFSVAVGSPAKVIRMLNPETEQWEPVSSDADVARIEAARARKPFPDRAAYKAILDKAGGKMPVHPAVAGAGLHLP